jgi:hypothetical protein
MSLLYIAPRSSTSAFGLHSIGSKSRHLPFFMLFCVKEVLFPDMVGIMLYIATQSTLFIFVVKVTTIISGTDD